MVSKSSDEHRDRRRALPSALVEMAYMEPRESSFRLPLFIALGVVLSVAISTAVNIALHPNNDNADSVNATVAVANTQTPPLPPSRLSTVKAGYFPNNFNPTEFGSIKHFSGVDIELESLDIFHTVKALEQVNTGDPYKMLMLPLFFAQYYGLSSTAFGTPFDLQMGTFPDTLCDAIGELSIFTTCATRWRDAMNIHVGGPFVTAQQYLHWWFTTGKDKMTAHLAAGGLGNVTVFVFAMDAPAVALASPIRLNETSDFTQLTIRSVGSSSKLYRQAGATVDSTVLSPKNILDAIAAGDINGFEHASIAQDLYSIILKQSVATYVYNDNSIEPFNVGHLVFNSQWYESLPAAERSTFEQCLERNTYNTLHLSELVNEEKAGALSTTSGYTSIAAFPPNIRAHLETSWNTVLESYGATFREWHQEIKAI
jgi:hypothetical protein